MLYWTTTFNPVISAGRSRTSTIPALQYNISITYFWGWHQIHLWLYDYHTLISGNICKKYILSWRASILAISLCSIALQSQSPTPEKTQVRRLCYVAQPSRLWVHAPEKTQARRLCYAKSISRWSTSRCRQVVAGGGQTFSPYQLINHHLSTFCDIFYCWKA